MQAKRYVMVVTAMALIFCLGACGKKTGLEGKLVDGKGQGLAGVKVIAKQVQPIKGYEQFEAVSGADGSFKFGKLFPSSRYVLKPWSEKWTTTTSVTVESAPEGQTTLLPAPLAVRYTVSKDGVITDSATALEWVTGPERDTNYYEGMAWVNGCQIAGGGWRMPNRSELRSLYEKGSGEKNIDPSFHLNSGFVWAEPRDASSAWCFLFRSGDENWDTRVISFGGRQVFGVRSLPRR